jgi:hypothetical protein
VIRPQSDRLESNEFYAIAYAVPASIVTLLVPLAYRATLVPRGTNFFNQPVFEFVIIPETEDIFHLDGEFFNVKPGCPIHVKLGPEIEMVRAF